MNALEKLEAVLCDPEGKCCIGGSDADRQIVDDSIESLRAALASQQEVAAPVGDAKRDAVMRHDYPVLQQFHTKHAMGPLAAPSCLCCGKSTQGVDIGVQHLELPGIVICMPCKEAASRVPVALVAEPVIDCDTCGQRVTGPCNAVDCTVPDAPPGAGGAGVMDARPDSFHSDSGECGGVTQPLTEAPRWQFGTWTLTAPDGRTWQADSPLKACSAEQRDRIPPEVALKRIFDALDKGE